MIGTVAEYPKDKVAITDYSYLGRSRTPSKYRGYLSIYDERYFWAISISLRVLRLCSPLVREGSPKKAKCSQGVADSTLASFKVASTFRMRLYQRWP